MNLRKDLVDLFLSEKRGMAIEACVSLASQLYHFISFGLRNQRTSFESAMLIISVDVDVGSRKLGSINQGKNDAHVHKYLSECFIGQVEERVLPIFIEAFDALEVPATFAIRGQLAEIADPFFQSLLDSPAKHDIGAHGYTHKSFRHLSRREAESELSLISSGLRKFGVVPRSFVFPRNEIMHLDLLEKHEYKCYREDSHFLTDGMLIRKTGGLYNIQPSLYLNYSVTPVVLNRILDVAIARKGPLHLWFHPWTFGFTPELTNRYVKDVFLPFLNRAKAGEKKNTLTFETMLSAARKADEMPRASEHASS